MNVYLVYGDIFPVSYAVNIKVFGIFTNRKEAEEAKLKYEDEYFAKLSSVRRKYVHREDFNFSILEIKPNECCDISIGEYME